MHAQVLGISVDSVPCLTAWAESLGGITYPLLSDFYPHGEVAQRYGVLRQDGRSERALFIIDKQGIVRYVDVHDIDEQPNNEELFRVLAELEPEAAAVLAATQPTAQPEPTADVVMYCTPWCPACRRARAYLQQHGIDYVEVDVFRDRAAAERVRGWADGYETTPTFNIKGTIIVGFEPDKLGQALGIA
ncbi:MAG: redoxin domain-containing protein [Anaerolineales bacterium]|nr:MAG: redoxin domain-containing protein [Anaerolineales bacterium]